MPGIKISKPIKDHFPVEERAALEGKLWEKSGGMCALCGVALNKAADDIEPDHDVPEAEGGETSIANLNLVHRTCNRFKRNAPSVDVRPYLKFKAYLDAQGGLLKYGACMPHFKVVPKPCVLEFAGDEVKIHLPNGTFASAPVLVEKRGEKQYRCFYFLAPMDAIFNDDEVQPRAVKSLHVYSILMDLYRNPLHEAPACRIETVDGKSKLLMFDGQHKTLASWMAGYETVAMKVYLDFTKESAVELVNSIQARIKKLPLSPFELSKKLGDEWAQELERYEDQVGEAEVSESGFISWLPQARRTRGKQAFKAALIQTALENIDLEFMSFVAHAGKPEVGKKITENMFKSKVLEELFFLNPIDLKGEALAGARSLEQQSIVRVLNSFVRLAFDNDGSPQAESRIERMSKQASLEYIFGKLVKGAVEHLVAPGNNKVFLLNNPTVDQWNRIDACLKRIVEHPCWTAALNSSPAYKALDDALQKNQGTDAAFNGIGLTLGYVVGVA